MNSVQYSIGHSFRSDYLWSSAFDTYQKDFTSSSISPFKSIRQHIREGDIPSPVFQLFNWIEGSRR